MRPSYPRCGFVTSIVFVAAIGLLPMAVSAATLTIVNDNAPGVGFNDPTPVSPVAGNPGTTLGQQRLNVFQAALDTWGNTVASAVEIPVIAEFSPLNCGATSGVLGAAGPDRYIRGGGLGPVWHPFALANAREGIDIGPLLGLPANSPNIFAVFNSAVDDDPGCLTGFSWWYGIGSPAPANTFDLFGAIFHEVAHGLGFATIVDRATGAKFDNTDDVYMRNLEDHNTGELWPNMTDGERAASILDTGDLHWVGPSAVAQSGVLSNGVHPTGHIQMYAPDPSEAGSSTSHWDTALLPDEVMEPFAEPNAQNLVTTNLMQDIGWELMPSVGTCVPDNTTLCLNNDRFKVQVAWATATDSGPGVVVPGGTDDSSNLYFFDANNWEMLIKVLNGCAFTNHYWVFFAATTDVEFTVTVTDTQNGAVETYFNPLGQPANAVTDTFAFATCP